MRVIFSILAIALFASCTPETIVVDCGFGKVETKLQLSPNIKSFLYSYTCNGEKISFYSIKDVRIGYEICK